ncbi:hypothetical protein GGR57DRAFT_484567 [Xylariaceae sp. FL1272]|nr:hypothetical protein GGR57DRAFT_484567 [Xylariaceae sp. FL1272]
MTFKIPSRDVQHHQRTLFFDWEQNQRRFQTPGMFGLTLHDTVRDYDLIDFLLACLHSSAAEAQSSDNSNTMNVPLDPSNIVEVIDSFPPIHPRTTAIDLVNFESYYWSRERLILLLWLDSCFSRKFASTGTPAGNHVSSLPTMKQFCRVNTWDDNAYPIHEGQPRKETGWAGFHGTPPRNLFSILLSGLVAPPGRNGQVFFASHPDLSLWYIKSRSTSLSAAYLQGWKHSAFRNVVVLLGVEALEPVPWKNIAPEYYDWRQSNCHESQIIVRHIFVFPPSAVDLDPEYTVLVDPSTGRLMDDGYSELARREMQEAYENMRKRWHQEMALRNPLYGR